jgi:signal transduction histidine kinase
VRPEIRVCARRTDGDVGPMVELEISDNGIGIPDGQHDQVFDSFHRAHKDGYRGTGLGLSIVKRIVERHGGTASARDNATGGGTTMRVSFPAARLADGPNPVAPQEH